MSEESNGNFFIDPVLGKVRLIKGRNYRNITISVNPVKGVTIRMPFYMKYKVGLDFFNEKYDDIVEMYKRGKARVEASDERYDADGRLPVELAIDAAAVLPARLDELATRYGFKYAGVSVRAAATRWGSCSYKGRISLNIRLVQLPALLRDYVLLHELSHLRHFDHGPDFHALLERLCEDNLSRSIKEIKSFSTREEILRNGKMDEKDLKFLLQTYRGVKASKSFRPVSYTLECELKSWVLPMV